MSRRSRPQYRSGLGWILGVAFEDTLTRPVRLAQGFTCVRCCGTPRASSPHDLTAPALASHDGRDCVQLPLARGCYHLAPRGLLPPIQVPIQAHLEHERCFVISGDVHDRYFCELNGLDDSGIYFISL